MTVIVRLAICMVLSGCGSQATDGSTSGRLPFTPDPTPPAEGWRWESSLGVEVAVPDDWAVNDTDCRQTDAPTVVRSQGVIRLCATPEPPNKQIVEITRENEDEEPPPPEEFAVQEIMIDGKRAQRIEGTIPDGRAAGWLKFPGLDDVLVRARVRDEELLHRIFDSVRVVDVDANGCATARSDMRAKPPRANTLLPRDTTAVSICFFLQRTVLATSALLDGAEAAELAELVNRAEPGRTPDVPTDRCGGSYMPLPDVFLVGHAAQDDAIVELTYSECGQRGLQNGRETAKLSKTILKAIMNPLEVGYGYIAQGLRD